MGVSKSPHRCQTLADDTSIPQRGIQHVTEGKEGNIETLPFTCVLSPQYNQAAVVTLCAGIYGTSLIINSHIGNFAAGDKCVTTQYRHLCTHILLRNDAHYTHACTA